MGDAALVGHGDLAVEDEFPAEGGHRRERRAEEVGPVVAVAADQPQPAGAVDDRDQPVPVMLQLVQPSVAGGGLAAVLQT
jgi:hypothetical protein